MSKYYKFSYIGGESYCRPNDDGSISWFPPNENNRDYIEYLNWVAEGNEPEPWSFPDAD